MATESPAAEQRLANLIDQLGITRAHIALGPFSEQAMDLITLRPDVAASFSFVLSPRRLNTDALAHQTNVLCIAGQPMLPAMVRNLEAIRAVDGSRVIELPNEYQAHPWSDVVKDHTELVVASLRERARGSDLESLYRDGETGVVDGISYRIDGEGPPLLLFPINIAPTQWDAAIPHLRDDFSCIRLGGSHIGFVNLLEERAASGTYLQGVRGLFDLMKIGHGQAVLEVGTGSGALARDLARRNDAPASIVATDLNAFLLDEARSLGSRPGTPIEYRLGDAEALPFADATFDAAFAVTVFEECDVEKGLAELRRVLKTGGRTGVMIRCRDLPQYWNVDVTEELAQKLNRPQAQAVGPTGCVDATLYSRFATHFGDVIPGPFWASFTYPFIDFFVAQIMALLDPGDAQQLRQALAKGRADGTAFVAIPFHAVVGTKT